MGVVTPRREIATAAHVVWKARAITGTDAQGSRLAATVAHIDGRADLAVLRVERPPQHFAAIRVKPATVGQRVDAVASVRSGAVPGIASGTIGATRWTSYGVPVAPIFSGIEGEKGMSGGGLFDAAGEPVGIIIRIDRASAYLTALPIGEVRARLSRCAEKAPPASSATPSCATGAGERRRRARYRRVPCPRARKSCAYANAAAAPKTTLLKIVTPCRSSANHGNHSVNTW